MSQNNNKSINKNVYGIHSSTSILKSNPNSVVKVFIKKDSKSKQLLEIYSIAESKNIPITEADKDFLTMSCLSNKHQGVVCEINSISNVDFNLDMYLHNKKTPLIIIFDSIQDPRNLGSCIRSANAFGVSLIIKKKSQSCPITPLVHKAASGGLQGINLFESNNLAAIVNKLKKNNIFILGAHHNAKNEIAILQKDNLKCGCAIIVGSEGMGISKSLLKLCDEVYRIPTIGSVECLNVSVATGIMLHEVARFFKKSK